jgi:hypothetical protein
MNEDDKRRPGEGQDSDTHRVETPPPPAPREERPSAGGANMQRIGCGVLALLAEQGRQVLIQHSLEGFTGDVGFMPPKGGQMHLDDEAVIAALDYMLEQSR